MGFCWGFFFRVTPSLFYRPALVPRRQESHCRPPLDLVQKNILSKSSPRQQRAACLHVCKSTQRRLACPFCVLLFVLSVCGSCLCFFFPVPQRHLLVFQLVPPSSPGSGGGAVVIGNVLCGRQSAVAPRPSRRRPTTPSALRRVSFSQLPLRGVDPQGAPVLSEPLDVPVFLAEDGDLVLEQDGVQSHLGVDQRHGAKPAGELVHAGLPLGEVVRVGPARSPRRLGTETEKSHYQCRCSDRLRSAAVSNFGF